MNAASTAKTRTQKLLETAENLRICTGAFKGIQDLHAYQIENSLSSENIFFTLLVLTNHQESCVNELFNCIKGEV